MTLDQQIDEELRGLVRADRYREATPLSGRERHRPSTASGPVVAFCSNDYLGLAAHPDLARAAVRAVEEDGFGTGASRLVSGESPRHLALESALAGLVRRPAALLFPTGYQANLGVITSLAGPQDLIASDASNHASIIDACRLTRARIAIYRHCDADAAAEALSTAGSYRRRLLITESIFSMDGDRAPLVTLAEAAARHQALLIVDEAHALGAAGPQGAGLCAASGIVPAALVGTLGKSFGAAGGFVAGSTSLRALLLNRARTFIYTTAPPIPVAAAALAAVELSVGPLGDARRTLAATSAARLRSTLGRAGHGVLGEDLILPLLLGLDGQALKAAASLRRLGLLVTAIRPPTVPPGTARLRVTVSAAHTPDDIDRLATALLSDGLLPAPAGAPEAEVR